MKIVSWNIKGLGDYSKQLAVKHLNMKINPELVLIQETKKEAFKVEAIKKLWSSKDIGWSFVEAYGRSGGLLLIMWDESKISVIETLKGGYTLSVKCKTLCKKVCWVTNVYGPTDYKERKHIWPELQALAVYCTNAWCLGGDFNITRAIHERVPTGRLTRGMKKFNKFIEKAHLMEIPLSNGRFTWSREGIRISRSLLDRFFMTNEWDEAFEGT